MLTVRAAGATDRGTRRQFNEDVIDWWVAADRQTALAVLADGMGGYEGGEVASRLAVDACMETLQPLMDGQASTGDAIDAALLSATEMANRRIREARDTDDEHARMGTTLIIVWVQGSQVHIAHIGDSRVYRLTTGKALQLTRDDTVVQNMLDDGSIRPEDASQVPFRNILTKAVGTEATVLPSLQRVQVAAGERLLLCSDGLPEALPPSEWNGVTGGKASLATQARNLIAGSLAQGADDNVSVVLLGFSGERDAG